MVLLSATFTAIFAKIEVSKINIFFDPFGNGNRIVLAALLLKLYN
jgi:hypothetical protein